MKNIFAVITCFFLFTTAFSQSNVREEMSKTLIGNFQKTEYVKILESFDATMKSALPAEKLKAVWEQLNSQCGKYLKYSEIKEEKIQSYDACLVLCHFEKMNLQMKVIFNDKNQIAGLFFVPVNQ